MPSTPQETCTKVRNIIASGKLDPWIDGLVSLTIERQRFVRTLEASKIEIGDAVALRNIKPKYLNNMRGTVSGRPSEGKLEVHLDNRPPRGRYSQTVIVPAGAVRPV